LTTTQPLPPAARLLELEAEAHDLYPDHTFKAAKWHRDRLSTVEAKCESLEAGMAEFRRGLPENQRKGKA